MNKRRARKRNILFGGNRRSMFSHGRRLKVWLLLLLLLLLLL